MRRRNCPYGSLPFEEGKNRAEVSSRNGRELWVCSVWVILWRSCLDCWAVIISSPGTTSLRLTVSVWCFENLLWGSFGLKPRRSLRFVQTSLADRSTNVASPQNILLACLPSRPLTHISHLKGWGEASVFLLHKPLCLVLLQEFILTSGK